MRDCVGILVETAKVPTQMRHSLWQSARMTGSAMDYHGLGVTNHGRDDDSTRRTAAKPFGMESTRSGMPKQRLVGKPLVRRTRHKHQDLLYMAEEGLRRYDRAAKNASGSNGDAVPLRRASRTDAGVRHSPG